MVFKILVIKVQLTTFWSSAVVFTMLVLAIEVFSMCNFSDVLTVFSPFMSPVGATRDIGSALTRMCMRHRSIETKLRHFTKYENISPVICLLCVTV